MATVSYEILTTVRKAFYGRTLRAYVFLAQIIIKDMTEHNFAQLKLPVRGDMVVIPLKGHIPTRKEKTPTALKIAISTKMNLEKAKYEKLLKIVPDERADVVLTATGNYVNKLSLKEELSLKL